ncbi:HDOD domain-containing protein [Timonella sp. A28]|uniref:HDOD domain-containing protein n=1 Tax=Timonella sp. A28 TaxID=3442640 RepID=UPI003EB8043C
MHSVRTNSLPLFRFALYTEDRAREAYVFVPVHKVAALSQQHRPHIAPIATHSLPIDFDELASDSSVIIWADPVHLPITQELLETSYIRGIIATQCDLLNPDFRARVLDAVSHGLDLYLAYADPQNPDLQFMPFVSGLVVPPSTTSPTETPTTAPGPREIVWAAGFNYPARVAHGNAYIGAVHSAAEHFVGDFAPGELQCMKALQLLSNPNVSLPEVADVLDLDPVISVRALHLANSAAFGLAHRIDSLNAAVAYLGTQRISGLLIASLISSRQPHPDLLWFLLIRAEACRILASDGESAYTAGLVSSLADEMGSNPAELAEQTGLSEYIRDAFKSDDNELGTMINAVKAFEIGSLERIEQYGWDADDIAQAYLDALPRTREAINLLLAA